MFLINLLRYFELYAKSGSPRARNGAKRFRSDLWLHQLPQVTGVLLGRLKEERGITKLASIVFNALVSFCCLRDYDCFNPTQQFHLETDCCNLIMQPFQYKTYFIVANQQKHIYHEQLWCDKTDLSC